MSFLSFQQELKNFSSLSLSHTHTHTHSYFSQSSFQNKILNLREQILNPRFFSFFLFSFFSFFSFWLLLLSFLNNFSIFSFFFSQKCFLWNFLLLMFITLSWAFLQIKKMSCPREGVIHDPVEKGIFNGSSPLIWRNDWSLFFSYNADENTNDRSR